MLLRAVQNDDVSQKQGCPVSTSQLKKIIQKKKTVRIRVAIFATLFFKGVATGDTETYHVTVQSSN